MKRFPHQLPLCAAIIALAVGYLYRNSRRIADVTRRSSADDAVRVGRVSSASTAGSRGGSAAPASAGCGLLFFYHVNKVGGLTVQQYLRESTHEYLQLFPNGRDWSRALPEIEAFLRFDDDGGGGARWKALEIHHGFPGLLYLQKELASWESTVTAQGCAFRKATLLRSPVERLVSNMKWNHVTLDTLEYANNTANWMSRYLAFNTCNDNRVCRFTKRMGISNAPAMSDRAFLSLIEILDGFDTVGVMEDLQAFMDDLLGRRISLVSTHQQDYSREPYPLTADMYQNLMKLNPYDFRLYWRYAPAVLAMPTERAEDMTLEKMQRYYLLNKPVLVKGAARLLFRNHADFSSDYVRRHVDPAMKIRSTQNTGRLLNGDVTTTVPACMDAPGRCVYFRMTGFSYEEGEGAIRTDDPDPLRTTLLAGLNRSTFAWTGANSGSYCIYISAHGGALPHNHRQRFNLLTEGRKRWILVDPNAYANASQTEEFELTEDTGLKRNKKNRSRGNFTWEGTGYKPQQWFEDVIARGVDVPHYDFVQEAGDVFFLPGRFTHGTMDLTRRTVGIIFKGGMTEVGTGGLWFPVQSAAHLPWRPARAASLADRGHRLPTPLQRGRTGDEATPQRVAGGAAKLFGNEHLDYYVS